jgi:hypothetical protein
LEWSAAPRKAQTETFEDEGRQDLLQVRKVIQVGNLAAIIIGTSAEATRTSSKPAGISAEPAGHAATTALDLGHELLKRRSDLGIATIKNRSRKEEEK